MTIPLPKSHTHPPDVIDAGAVVLRRRRTEDAAAIAAVVRENLDHLEPWMPWATPDAGTEKAQRQRIQEDEFSWNTGSDHAFVIVAPADDGGEKIVGMCGLHRRIGEGGMEIGYWVDREHTGRGYATAAAQALTDVALSLHGVHRVEIHCDEANIPSQRVPARLGYSLDRIEDTPISAPGETGRSMVWVLEAGSSVSRS